MHEIFWVSNKVYLESILGLVWSILMNMGLGYMSPKLAWSN